MPKKCIKFVPEYLIPNLNNRRFGERLKWLDKNRQIFQIDWPHKSGPQWTEKGAEVFVEWDKHKGHFQPENKQYYTQSKQRFRALLYKLTREGQLIGLPSENKFKKVFCIGQKKSKKKRKDINAESDSYYEEHTSSEGVESEDTDDLLIRDVLKNDTANILGDHSYSASDNFQTSFKGFLASNAENEDLIFSFQDMCIPTSTTESSLEGQKRILMERNYENMPVMPNFNPYNFLNFSSFDFKEPEISAVSVPAATQDVSFFLNEFAEDDNALQSSTDFCDLWQIKVDLTKEEKK